MLAGYVVSIVVSLALTNHVFLPAIPSRTSLICIADFQLLVVYWLNIVRLQRGKKHYLEQNPIGDNSSELLDDWHDETDFENKRFVYAP